ncbi:MAG: hypothetical protein ABFD57_03720 [Smithella sp.]|nr:MFS transporter [Syntrophaceae bacterium]NTW77522.1 MFS transporter [Syntrophaceae bacterium]
MELISGFFTENPTIFKVTVGIVLVVIAYLVFKQFLKLSLVIFLIAAAGFGYHYYNQPQKISEDVQKVKSGVEKSKNFYKDSKDLIQKSARLPGEVNKLLKGEENKAEK